MRIGFNTGIQNHYSDYTSRIKQVSVSEVQKLDEDKKANEQTLAEQNWQRQDEEAAKAPREQKPVELQDISTKFNKDNTYDYIGKDSAVENLDVQKAVSDMQKDSILSQYQFFVGTEPDVNTVFQNNDGTVIRK